MNTCPCCHQPLKFRHEQKTLRNVLIQGDCTNPNCKMYESTMTMAVRPFTCEERQQVEAVHGVRQSNRLDK